ncbi:MAG: hypothetical protein SFV21_01215 [Rhodospirillaceae bacterium]|nr:hypothetical protein [Rhodospirillaceae bacterium]
MSKRIVYAALAAVASAVLSGCQSTILPPCPSVRVDSTTARLVQFRDGGGQTPADVAYEAQIVGYGGVCDFQDDGVAIDMNIDLLVAAGPATAGGRADLYYFVAIPQYFPDTQGKRIFSVRASVPSQPGRRERLSERGIRVFIPLKESEPAAAYDVYLGFQLTQAQLDFNRAQTAQ